MYIRNSDPDRSFDFVSKSDFDILCLQEVPESFVQRLSTLPYHVDVASEMDEVYSRKSTNRHSVILSRYPIMKAVHLSLPNREDVLAARAKLFVHLLIALGLWGRSSGNRHSQYVDLSTPHGPVRVFNLHLPLVSPAWRVEEFELALAEREPGLPTIVCGDFNILEHPSITPLSWLLGGTVSDAVYYRRERIQIEKRFVAHELTNALRGSVTHSFSRSQLDHILVSDNFTINNAEVIPDRHGSDHNPVYAEVIEKASTASMLRLPRRDGQA